MKKIYTLFLVLIITGSLMAQTPQSFKYQAVARDVSGNIVANQAVGMQISILQGSTSGTSVYVETFTPTTNGFGLINLNIGGGTVVSGDFTTIDWSTDTYFIKVEMNMTGGTTYEEYGTSQLLSVPYALHAKTAANTFSGNYNDLSGAPINVSTFTNDAGYLTTEADGDITNEIQDLNLTSNNLTITDNISPTTIDLSPYLDDQTVSITGDNGITVTGTYPNFTVAQTTKYQIGDFAQGGIVFWVDETGEHGLVCAKTDQSSGVRWYAGTDGYTRAKGDGPFAGEANTAIIIAAQVAIGDDGSTYAADICAELQITEGGKTYGDWYLPSKQELNLMYQNRVTINATATANGGVAFASDNYWSSTEHNNSNFAWVQHFSTGNRAGGGKSNTAYVRAVRAF